MTGAYSPYEPAARPGGHPAEKPRYRVLVHRKFARDWDALAKTVGLTSAQQFYDHVAFTPDKPPRINSSVIMRGKAGTPKFVGASRTVHYEISGGGSHQLPIRPRVPGRSIRRPTPSGLHSHHRSWQPLTSECGRTGVDTSIAGFGDFGLSLWPDFRR